MVRFDALVHIEQDSPIPRRNVAGTAESTTPS
jgi:hypothetical protein